MINPKDFIISEHVLTVSHIFKSFAKTNDAAVKYIKQILKDNKELKKYIFSEHWRFNTFTIGEYVFIDNNTYDDDYTCLRWNEAKNVLCVNFVSFDPFDDTAADFSIVLQPHHFYSTKEIKTFIDTILDEHIETSKRKELEILELEKERKEKALADKEAFELAEFKRLSKKFKTKK